MTETSEAQGIVAERKAKINPVETSVDHRGFFAKLFRRKQAQTPTPQQQISEVAIDKNGDAVHGIGDEVSEKELANLEGKSPAEPEVPFNSEVDPNALTGFAKKAVDKQLNTYPDTNTPEDGHSFDPSSEPPILDQIGTGPRVNNPPYQPGTAENVTPISGNVQQSPKKTGW